MVRYVSVSPAQNASCAALSYANTFDHAARVEDRGVRHKQGPLIPSLGGDAGCFLKLNKKPTADTSCVNCGKRAGGIPATGRLNNTLSNAETR